MTSAITDRTAATRGLGLFVAAALALAGCSSSGSGPTSNPGANGTPAPGATVASQPTAAATTAAGGGGGGGGTAGNVCDLVTAAEMSAATKIDGVATRFVPGPPDNCAYSKGDQTSVGSLTLTPQGGGLAFGVIAGDSTSTPYPGIGDKALYNATAESFVVLKGDKLLVIVLSILDADLKAPRVDIMKQLATIAAGRM